MELQVLYFFLVFTTHRGLSLLSLQSIIMQFRIRLSHGVNKTASAHCCKRVACLQGEFIDFISNHFIVCVLTYMWKLYDGVCILYIIIRILYIQPPVATCYQQEIYGVLALHVVHNSLVEKSRHQVFSIVVPSLQNRYHNWRKSTLF